jgi:hypothetical protein
MTAKIRKSHLYPFLFKEVFIFRPFVRGYPGAALGQIIFRIIFESRYTQKLCGYLLLTGSIIRV